MCKNVGQNTHVRKFTCRNVLIKRFAAMARFLCELPATQKNSLRTDEHTKTANLFTCNWYNYATQPKCCRGIKMIWTHTFVSNKNLVFLVRFIIVIITIIMISIIIKFNIKACHQMLEKMVALYDVLRNTFSPQQLISFTITVIWWNWYHVVILCICRRHITRLKTIETLTLVRCI